MTANNVDSSNIILKRRKLIHVYNELKNHRIIAVCAPAGYGKTVAVTEWLSNDTRAKTIFFLG
jgi:ATP/maltotriose-dependent transcriptional regulator MalT